MALVGKNSEKNNQNLMQLIRRAHGLVENPDLEKHRQSQDHIGELLGNSKEIQYRPVDIEGMDAEWVSVNRAHMKKYVILHCHGGGYSTGSSIYARTLTSKLASGTSMDVLCFDYRLAPEHPYPAATQDAMKAWRKLAPDMDLCRKMSAALAQQKTTDEWTRERGRYIPYPASWLNGRRWEDEPDEMPSASQGTVEEPEGVEFF